MLTISKKDIPKKNHRFLGSSRVSANMPRGKINSNISGNTGPKPARLALP
jgi:hypothetical protein